MLPPDRKARKRKKAFGSMASGTECVRYSVGLIGRAPLRLMTCIPNFCYLHFPLTTPIKEKHRAQIDFEGGKLP